MAFSHYLYFKNLHGTKGHMLVHRIFSTKSRINEFGIPMIPSSLAKKLFGKKHGISDQTRSHKVLIELARLHLDLHEIPWKSSISQINADKILSETEEALHSCELPSIRGSLDEHFNSLALNLSSSWLDRANRLALNELPAIPKCFSSETYASFPPAGWTRYDFNTGEGYSVPHPSSGEDLFFDIEMCPRISKHAVMAVAVSSKAWYSWRSPILDQINTKSSSELLIPLGKDHLVIGHNVSFDRARILEEYSIGSSNDVNYLDTMALHCAVSGLSNQQRRLWLKYRKLLKELNSNTQLDGNDSACLDDLSKENENYLDDIEINETFDSIKKYAESKLGRWIHNTASNSLVEAAAFHCKIPLASKIERNLFINATDLNEVTSRWHTLLSYCANDVLLTHKLFRVILPKFLVYNPHPVTFSSLLIMGKMILPTDSGWYSWISECEVQLANFSKKLETALHDFALEVIEKYCIVDGWKDDPWLKHLDWTLIPSKYCLLPKLKKPRKVESKGSEQTITGYAELNTQDEENTIVEDISREYDYTRPIGNPMFFGKPAWYKKLWDSTRKSVVISSRMSIVPYLLGITWKNRPVHHLGVGIGWSFLQKDGTYSPIHGPEDKRSSDSSNDDTASVGILISKAFYSSFKSGELKATRRQDLAEMSFEACTEFSFWTSYRSRVAETLAVDLKIDNGDEVNNGNEVSDGGEENYKNIPLAILPQMCTMGTITRRATDRLWLTSTSVAKNSVLGSDLKNRMVAPSGWKFVGADVDAQELWISSIFGDAQFGEHGSTALSWMGLAGSKVNGTDLHSKTKTLLGEGATRDLAKVFNYARFYGSGVKFASALLQSTQPYLSKKECNEKAANLYKETKGEISDENSTLFSGGSESFMFNSLSALALGRQFSLSRTSQIEDKNENKFQSHEQYKEDDTPRTPFLKCRITDALTPWNVGEGSQFATSRMNWVVQSSAVDYLHLLLTGMVWLCQKHEIIARLAITIHDEVRWLVKEKHAIRAAIALQIANLWTRAYFSESLAMEDLPLSVAFFSSVEIDSILRKDPKSSCISPTQHVPIPPGLSFTFSELITERRKELGITKNQTLTVAELLGKPIGGNDVQSLNVPEVNTVSNDITTINSASIPKYIPESPSIRISVILAQDKFTTHPEYHRKIKPLLLKKKANSKSTSDGKKKRTRQLDEIDEFGDPVLKTRKASKNRIK